MNRTEETRSAWATGAGLPAPPDEDCPCGDFPVAGSGGKGAEGWWQLRGLVALGREEFLQEHLVSAEASQAAWPLAGAWHVLVQHPQRAAALESFVL